MRILIAFHLQYRLDGKFRQNQVDVERKRLHIKTFSFLDSLDIVSTIDIGSIQETREEERTQLHIASLDHEGCGETRSDRRARQHWPVRAAGFGHVPFRPCLFASTTGDGGGMMDTYGCPRSASGFRLDFLHATLRAGPDGNCKVISWTFVHHQTWSTRISLMHMVPGL